MSRYESPVIAFDVDGVLLDYMDGFVRWLRERGYVVTKEAHEIDDWDFVAIMPGVTAERFSALIGEFAVSPEFGELPAIRGAREALMTLREEFPDHEFVAITSAGTSPVTERLRRANLDLHDFGISSVTVLPLGASKRDKLMALPDGSIFVDDLYRNIRVAEECGLSAILFKQPYSARDEHHLSAADWSEALPIIRELLDPPRAIPSAA